MTDASFAALLAVAACFYVRGLATDDGPPALVVAGSVASALALLIRQQGMLIPLAVLAFLLLSRRLPLDRRGAALAARVIGVPVAAAVAYWLWLGFVHGVPAGQQMFTEELSLFWRWETPRFWAIC